MVNLIEKGCTKCKTNKPLSDFYKDKKGKHGHQAQCKVCTNTRTKVYASLNKDKIRSAQKAYVKRHPERRKESCAKYLEVNRGKHNLAVRKWQDKNPEKVKSISSKWKKDNPDKHRATQAQRRAVKLRATPGWLSKDQISDIKSVYSLASKLGKFFGIDYHVDHIVPLKGKGVCGLHVPWNLQILEARLNKSKSNKFEGNYGGL